MLAELKRKISAKIATCCGKQMSKLFYKFLVSTGSLKFSDMELVDDDDDIATIITIYYLLEIDNPRPVELFPVLAGPEPIQIVPPVNSDERSINEDQSHHDIEEFNGPDVDEVLEDIDDEGTMEGQDIHPICSRTRVVV
ncbi:hypothetical protein GOBAR_DD32553 [Gossypium barbadense]|nr:hypothetical protein GOBAR_DD32553 [Gossypium barbadense]